VDLVSLIAVMRHIRQASASEIKRGRKQESDRNRYDQRQEECRSFIVATRRVKASPEVTDFDHEVTRRVPVTLKEYFVAEEFCPHSVIPMVTTEGFELTALQGDIGATFTCAWSAHT